MTTRRKAKLSRRARDNSTLEKEGNSNCEDEKKYVNTDIELTFDVLTIIFKNLNAKDLYSAAIVCRSWNEAAENEKRIRGAAVIATLSDLDNSWVELEQFAQELPIKPMLGLMFTRPFDERHPATNEDKTDCLCRSLPSSCPNIVVGNCGLIKDEMEFEEESVKATWTLFPHDKSVNIEIVGVPLESNEGNREPRHHCNATKRLKELSTAKNKVKCFILLTNPDFPKNAFILLHMPRDQERTVSGGIVCDLAVCKRDKSGKMCSEAMAWIGILISGPSVRSWSVILTRKCNTKDKIAAKLKLLRGKVQLRKHSVGFMFACQGRGECMFGEKNVESTAFKKLFPEVPLIGSFGGGEYGDSSVVNVGDTGIWNVYGVDKQRKIVCVGGLKVAVLPSLSSLPPIIVADI